MTFKISPRWLALSILLTNFAALSLDGFCQNQSTSTLPVILKSTATDPMSPILWIMVENEKPKSYFNLVNDVCEKAQMKCKVEFVGPSSMRR
jgi:hypothetical protein